jgi:hypothetical protein
MSTSETDEYKVGICPCGQGAVMKTIVTQDNPGAAPTYRIVSNRMQPVPGGVGFKPIRRPPNPAEFNNSGRSSGESFDGCAA